MNKFNLMMLAIFISMVGLSLWVWLGQKETPRESTQEIIVDYGDIRKSVSATGNIQPQNRLGIKPPIGGRVEQVLVKEGDFVKTGQVLAIMSSTERAALLDAARAQGDEAYKNWLDVYLPTSLLAPLDGQVIVQTVQPGQTVTTADDVLVLSDRLIVQAQVDETDIGKVKLGQMAQMSLDAYPDLKVTGQVNHIYYESKLVNNVTIYSVDILPEQVPDVFRSGMSTNVEIIEQQKDHVLIVPKQAVHHKADQSSVLIKKPGVKKPIRQMIEVGMSDENSEEVIDGLKQGDVMIIQNTKYSSPKNNFPRSSSPFMPGGNRAR